VLIAAVVLGSEGASTLGRDTMFAVLMIVLNGVVNLALLLGGLRHHEQAYNLQGAVAYLAAIIPLSVIALILPNFTQAEPIGSLSTTQAAFFSMFTLGHCQLDILLLARWACIIEDHYSTKRGRWTPMDIEWAKDGRT
jgi:Ca2+:H+ antiporter